MFWQTLQLSTLVDFRQKVQKRLPHWELVHSSGLLTISKKWNKVLLTFAYSAVEIMVELLNLRGHESQDIEPRLKRGLALLLFFGCVAKVEVWFRIWYIFKV